MHTIYVHSLTRHFLSSFTHAHTSSFAESTVVEHIFDKTLLERLISLSKAEPLQWLLLTLWNNEKHLLSSLILKDPLLM